MMNKTQITLIIFGFLILALMATNPSIEDHREGVQEMYKKKLGETNKDKQNDLGYQIGTGLGMMIGDGFINKIVSRDNFLLFSLTRVSVADKTKNIGVGILGQVFLQDYNKIKKEFANGSINKNSISLFKDGDDTNSDVIGNIDKEVTLIPNDRIEEKEINRDEVPKYILSCYPPNGTNLILMSPNKNDIHPAWIESYKAEGTLGSGWSFNAIKKVQNEQGVFLFGNIFTTRGSLFNSSENGYSGMVYVPLDEWDCSAYKE